MPFRDLGFMVSVSSLEWLKVYYILVARKLIGC